MSDLIPEFLAQATSRLEAIAQTAASGGYDEAIDLIVASLDDGGVLQAFGTGHSQAFAMEIAGRAGGLIPTNNLALRDVVLHGSRNVSDLGGSSLERDPSVVDELFSVSPINPADVFLIASNSGVNGSIVGVALRAKELGHKVIGVTSIEHTTAVEPKHPSGKRLSEIADVVIDNRAPFGDTTLSLPGDVGVGAISSITSAFIAQLLTIEVSRRISDRGAVPPLYISANIPGGDEHNTALENLYRDRIRRTA
ncbi:MAG: SIS domain-containing protein [Mycetocola sp.]